MSTALSPAKHRRTPAPAKHRRRPARISRQSLAALLRRVSLADLALLLIGTTIVVTVTITGIEESSAAPTPADPGQAVITYMRAHGATMPDGWTKSIDDHHALICHEYAIGYANEPAGARDEWGVTVPLAEAAIRATGFCGGGR